MQEGYLNIWINVLEGYRSRFIEVVQGVIKIYLKKGCKLIG
jgi:hypothetical protein